MKGDEAPEEVMRGVAFDLLADAFLDLAETHLALDREGGRQLLHGLETRVVAKLDRFRAAHPEMDRPEVLGAAALRVRTVLRAARGEDETETA